MKSFTVMTLTIIHLLIFLFILSELLEYLLWMRVYMNLSSYTLFYLQITESEYHHHNQHCSTAKNTFYTFKFNSSSSMPYTD